MKKLILLYSLLFLSSVSAQELQFINAPSGLIIRETPSKISKRVGKLEYGDVVNVIRKTEIKINIKDEGKNLSGQWVEINDIKRTQRGFIFDGYLAADVVNRGKETKNFYITKFHPNRIKDYSYALVNNLKTKSPKIKLRDKNHNELYEFSIGDLEMYDSTSLFEQNITDLANITKIITIISNYYACCSSTEETTFLVDLNNNLIELPEIGNSHCDGPEPYYSYIFPDHENGQKDKIIYARLTPIKDSKKEEIEILKTYFWNGIKLVTK